MNGATIGVDKSATRILDGEIYALEHDGMLRVKYLYRLPAGGMRLRSFNTTEHPDEEYSAEQIETQQIRILGYFGGRRSEKERPCLRPINKINKTY